MVNALQLALILYKQELKKRGIIVIILLLLLISFIGTVPARQRAQELRFLKELKAFLLTKESFVIILAADFFIGMAPALMTVLTL